MSEATETPVEVPQEWGTHLEWLDKLTLLEASKLVEHLEDKWGVTAAAPAMAMMAPAGGDDGGEEEKSTYDVVLKAPGPSKIPVIKAVKEIIGQGLKESKALVDAAPKAIKTGLSKDEAEAIKAKLEEAGAEVELK